ncbi:hypothetical protein TCON_0681 [Astathelohania contejeani]|uniref:Exocyst complex component Sec6 n=1 Tax=Astathelohania contejeani TaxID=164912 RepID=A0ABQ7I127_9MICR|nr:hypothetical protein TCON_0681 [Thelohania contejeani]
MKQELELKKYAEQLERTNKLSKQIELTLGKIQYQLDDIPLDITKKFDKYMLPKQNIDMIVNFYDTYILAMENIEKQKREIDEIKKNEIKKHGFSQELRLIECYNAIIIELNRIKRYKSVNIVNTYILEIEDFCKAVLTEIKESYFIVVNDLLNEMEINDDIFKISKFLLENCKKTELEGEYVKLFVDKFSSKSLSQKKNKLVERIETFKNLMHKIKIIIDSFIGPNNVVYTEIRALLIIDIKDVLAKVLMDVENKSRDSDCVFLIHLCRAIGYKNEFELDPFIAECFKLINNALISFESRLEKVKKHDKKLMAEEYNLLIVDIVKEFKMLELVKINENESQLKKFLNDFEEGQTFEDFKNKWGTMCIKKTYSLARNLGTLERHIYLLNNFYEIQKIITRYEDTALAGIIDSSAKSIIKIWNDECKKRADPMNYIKRNIDVQGKYFINEDMRPYLIEKIERIVKDVLGHKYKKKDFALDLLFSGI